MKQLIGQKDALALSLASAGVFVANPLFSGTPALTPALAASFAGGAALGWSRLKHLLDRTDTEKTEGFVLPSDAPFPETIGMDGLRLGYTKDKFRPLDIENRLLTYHFVIIGQSGVGKTTLGEFLLWQQTARGSGWLFIDAKLDTETRDKLAYMAEKLGRKDDFYVLNVDDPANSNTYNPLLSGDPDEVASRLLNLLPSSENNIGADFYKQQANQALTVIVAAMQASRRLYHFGDLAILLQSARAIEELERNVPEDAPERRALQVFLDQFRRKQGKAGVQVDVNRLKEVLGGMAGRIAMFAQGKFGKVFNTYMPQIDLTDIVVNNKMLYVMLPTMGKEVAAQNLGKMILSDLRTTVYKLQAMPKHLRPNPPYMAFLDELGSYVIPGLARLAEQMRSAGIFLVPGFQSFANLASVSKEFPDMIIQNTWTKCFFKFGSNESAEKAADIIGKINTYSKTISKSENKGKSKQLLRVNPQASTGDGDSAGESWKQTEKHRVSPENLKALGIGEAVVVSGPRVFHINTPMLTFPPNIPPFQVTRFPTRMQKGWKGLNFEKRYRNFLLSDENQQKEDSSKKPEENQDGKKPGSPKKEDAK